MAELLEKMSGKISCAKADKIQIPVGGQCINFVTAKMRNKAEKSLKYTK